MYDRFRVNNKKRLVGAMAFLDTGKEAAAPCHARVRCGAAETPSSKAVLKEEAEEYGTGRVGGEDGSVITAP